MPDIEPIYMSEKNSNCIKENRQHLKNVPALATENAQKVGRKILEI